MAGKADAPAAPAAAGAAAPVEPDWARLREHAGRQQGVVFFAAGFLLDSLTLDRIDAWLDLGVQAAYLAALALLILLQRREQLGLWKPAGLALRAWRRNLEALHFCFGGLLSAYLFFFGQSGTAGSSALFFAALAGLMVYNERSEAQEQGLRFRLTLFAFCLACYLSYLVPVLLGRMGAGIFALSLGLAALGSGLLARTVGRMRGAGEGTAPAPQRGELLRFGAGPAAVLALLAALYAARWIPPVPLSLKALGIYHGVRREGAGYVATYERRGRLDVFRRQDIPFYARPGDRVYCFASVFAPARFTHEVSLHWLRRERGEWVSRDRIPLPVSGGRGSGYRGYAFKANHAPGRWKVRVETGDGRSLGERAFDIRADGRGGERLWAEARR